MNLDVVTQSPVSDVKGLAVGNGAVLKREVDMARRMDMLNYYVWVVENTYSGPVLVTLASARLRGVQLVV
jgi:hypothetical protein